MTAWKKKNPDSPYTKNDYCRFMHSGLFKTDKTLEILQNIKEYRKFYKIDEYPYGHKKFD